MTKTDFTNSYSTAFGVTKKLAAEIYDWIGDELLSNLKKPGSKEVTLFGLGKLFVAARASRVGRNPRTGVTVGIPQRNVVKFKAGKELKTTSF